MKKIIISIITALLAILAIGNSTYIANAKQAGDPTFSFLNPWSSFRSYVAQDKGGIPETFVQAQEEFSTWITMFSSPSDYMRITKIKLLGNVCETGKVQSLKNRINNYIKTRHEISVGWKDVKIASGEEQKFYQENLQKALTKFLTSEFAKIDKNGAGYTLLGPKCKIDCELKDVKCEEKDRTGEYYSDYSYLRKYAKEARALIISLYCEYGKTPKINETNAYSAKAESLKYIDAIVKFYTKAAGRVQVSSLNLVYDLNKNKTVEKWKQEQEQCAKNSSADSNCEDLYRQVSCLDSLESERFLNVNYAGDCKCPSFEKSTFDFKGMFDEILSNSKEFTKNYKAIRELVSKNNGQDIFKSLGNEVKSWWDESKQTAEIDFEKNFGYPPQKSRSENILTAMGDFFTKSIGGLDLARLRVNLNNQVMKPPQDKEQILREMTKNNGVASLLAIQGSEAEQKATYESQLRQAGRGVKLLRLKLIANTILNESIGLQKASVFLSTAGCDQFQKSAGAAYKAIGQNSDLVDKKNFYKGVASVDRALKGIFGKRNDACKLMDQLIKKYDS
ncbi:MAG: hypothetical protein NTZ80_01965 [Patescibacteria group bacterium]|nr:hypothetical protein [Patescibacteria group bacterium]